MNKLLQNDRVATIDDELRSQHAKNAQNGRTTQPALKQYKMPPELTTVRTPTKKAKPGNTDACEQGLTQSTYVSESILSLTTQPAYATCLTGGSLIGTLLDA